MTVLHSGTTKKYSDNWAQVFGRGAKRGGAKPAPAGKGPAKKSVAAKSAKRAAGKKRSTAKAKKE